MKLQLTYHFETEEELRAHLGGETRTAPAAAPVAAAPIPAAAPVAAAPIPAAAPVAIADESGTVSRDALDGDGMPYDESVHSDPPSFTSDGLWRAKRGKAEEAKAARAAFKARGGAVAAPADLPAAAPIAAPTVAPAGMPGMPVAAAAPTALPVDAPEPISLDRVIEKITGMINRGTLGEQTLAGLYAKHSGVADPAASFNVFNTNESARAHLFADLCNIEPEMA